MGVERVTAILQGKKSCYETELFEPLFAKIRELSKISSDDKDRSERVIADHLRAATFIIADGVVPGNVDQSYVLRRLIRRAIREGHKLGIDCRFTHLIAEKVVDNYSVTYPELGRNRDKIRESLCNEEEMFEKTLEKGTKEFEKLIGRVPPHIAHKVISGKNAFYLYETYGFPIELTEEMAKEKGFSVDKEGFDKSYQKHQELSRQGAEQKFKGGLADNSEMTTNLHTATHLLHEALRRVLGPHVAQKGSNITAERLRFDFSHPDKMTPEQVSKVEAIVNEMIKKAIDIKCDETTVEDAKSKGAIGLFVDRYGDKVRMYSIGDFSREICGGPHAENTARLGIFKILKEESSSQGVRRIKAILSKE